MTIHTGEPRTYKVIRSDQGLDPQQEKMTSKKEPWYNCSV